ncbi:hypothetical protein BGZ58_002796 [Dissophora ornata]|nr:hypothetical protein BGZ58_002796 [Dissophora ornata]
MRGTRDKAPNLSDRIRPRHASTNDVSDASKMSIRYMTTPMHTAIPCKTIRATNALSIPSCSSDRDADADANVAANTMGAGETATATSEEDEDNDKYMYMYRPFWSLHFWYGGMLPYHHLYF